MDNIPITIPANQRQASSPPLSVGNGIHTAVAVHVKNKEVIGADLKFSINNISTDTVTAASGMWTTFPFCGKNVSVARGDIILAIVTAHDPYVIPIRLECYIEFKESVLVKPLDICAIKKYILNSRIVTIQERGLPPGDGKDICRMTYYRPRYLVGPFADTAESVSDPGIAPSRAISDDSFSVPTRVTPIPPPPQPDARIDYCIKDANPFYFAKIPEIQNAGISYARGISLFEGLFYVGYFCQSLASIDNENVDLSMIRASSIIKLEDFTPAELSENSIVRIEHI